MKKHNYIRPFTIWALLLIFLFSCESGNESVEVKNIVRINIGSNPRTVNPFYYSSNAEKLLTSLQFQTLLAVNNTNDGIVPLLAESIPEKIVFDDSVVLKYNLRKDASWTDGSLVTSEDVLNTFRIIFNPHSELSGLRDYFGFIRDIRIQGKHRFVIVSDYDNPDIIFQSGDIEIVPTNKFDPEGHLSNYSIPDLQNYDPELQIDTILLQHGSALQKLTLLEPGQYIYGSAPYKMISFSESDKVVLTKKGAWWGDKYKDVSLYFEAFPETVELKIFTDPMPASIAFGNGELDVLRAVNEQVLSDLMENEEILKKTKVESQLLQGFVYLSLNTRHPLLKDKNLRRALSFLVDSETFIENVLNGAGKAVCSPITPLNEQLYNDDLQAVSFNIDSAKYYLLKGGWEEKEGAWFRNGEKLQLPMLVQSGNRNSEDFGVFLKNNASKAGIEIQLLPMEFAAFIQKLRSGDYAIARLGMRSGFLNYDFRPLFHSENIEGGRNYPAFSNSQADALIDSLETVNKQEIVINISHQLQKIIFDDYSYIFLYIPLAKTLIRDEISHFRFLPSGGSPWPGSVKYSDNE
jgi:peptide/nickel transport system substrate-binding protein